LVTKYLCCGLGSGRTKIGLRW